MGVFSKNQGGRKKLKRNNFDLSRTIHGTYQIGKHYPFSVREVLPGDKVKLSVSCGLRFMPTVFPIQNRMKCKVSYFYVRDRGIYEDFENFSTSDQSTYQMPYLDVDNMTESTKKELFDFGGLGDHMGLPVSRHIDRNFTYSRELISVVSRLRTIRISDGFGSPVNVSSVLNKGFDSLPNTIMTNVSFNTISGSSVSLSGIQGLFYGLYLIPNDNRSSYNSYAFSGKLKINFAEANPSDLSLNTITNFLSTAVSPAGFYLAYDNIGTQITGLSKPFDITSSTVLPAPNIEFYHSSAKHYIGLVLYDKSLSSNTTKTFSYNAPTSKDGTVEYVSDSSFYTSVYNSGSYSAFTFPKNPINSLPFRGYEQIYNAFYRDERNNPLLVDGKPVYNEFVTTKAGGADSTSYHLFNSNWEQDFLTTALPSPQQGIAPLVGISSAGTMSIQDPDTGKTYEAQAVTADDNDTIIGANFIETETSKDGIPNSVSRALIDYASSGISINDFRNVNALQRWKETNLRKGLKYKDMYENRYGVTISYAAMNMPEFLGGFNFDVQTAQINNTNGDGADPLGSYAGQLTAMGGSKHKIVKTFDEPGYLIGILTIVPVPIYEQLLPKHFTKFNVLDFWSPEFNHIGLQPIPYREVDPVGVSISSDKTFTDTFGYQRPWYDYVSSVDEVHGQFRGSLSNFVMYRSFSTPPSLSPEFLTIDNKTVDQVFSVQEDADGNSVDKALGLIYEDAIWKRPVSRIVSPSIN